MMKWPESGSGVVDIKVNIMVKVEEVVGGIF
jgi:hypothetical protein